ncbi:hypothetical protein FIBSPDRAFT_81626 [Athelia psychrophila]|uniref:Uncharacterized protein n=1 Tax=Athelia psychrophila TaxID=1759441 RepID=A0A166E5X8_9AGAM|nr:hypothetical protein FIBSPDRAFT_81626 [Fibularhizoctonia sp. CBS 109695]
MSNSATTCAYVGGPPMNTDISGVGVRVSFYLQTLFIGFQAARSGSRDDISGAEYTLIATNIAMAVTALILGLQPEPDISFHDALVVLYLLTLCWVTNFCLLAFVEGDAPILQLLSVFQSIVVFAFALAGLITAPIFGSNPGCNDNARLVFLRPIRFFNTGRIVGGAVCGIVVFLYIYMTVRGYLVPLIAKVKAKKAASALPANVVPAQTDFPMHVPKSNFNVDIEGNSIEVLTEHRDNNDGQTWSPDFDGPLTGQLLVILILWALTVMNTELLIVWNHFAPSDSPQSIWQFGQILPLLLIIVPFVGMVKVFMARGLRKVSKEEQGKRKEV